VVVVVVGTVDRVGGRTPTGCVEWVVLLLNCKMSFILSFVVTCTEKRRAVHAQRAGGVAAVAVQRVVYFHTRSSDG
jgi:hypothetical protein